MFTHLSTDQVQHCLTLMMCQHNYSCIVRNNFWLGSFKLLFSSRMLFLQGFGWCNSQPSLSVSCSTLESVWNFECNTMRIDCSHCISHDHVEVLFMLFSVIIIIIIIIAGWNKNNVLLFSLKDAPEKHWLHCLKDCDNNNEIENSN